MGILSSCATPDINSMVRSVRLWGCSIRSGHAAHGRKVSSVRHARMDASLLSPEKRFQGLGITGFSHMPRKREALSPHSPKPPLIRFSGGFALSGPCHGKGECNAQGLAPRAWHGLPRQGDALGKPFHVAPLVVCRGNPVDRPRAMHSPLSSPLALGPCRSQGMPSSRDAIAVPLCDRAGPLAWRDLIRPV